MTDFFKLHNTLLTEAAYHILLAIFIFALCFLAAKSVKKILRRTLTTLPSFDKTFLPFLETSVSYGIAGIGLLIILTLFGVNINSLLTIIGAAGLAVALAMKNILSDLASGIFLLILRPFKNDETVDVDGMTAKVVKLGFFFTQLMTGDGVEVSYPNTKLWTNVIKNYSRNDIRRLTFTVDVAYEQSLKDVTAALQKIVKSEPRFLKDPAPMVIVADFKDSAVSMQVRAWTTLADYWDAYWATNAKIKEAGETGALNFPYPQMDVHIDNKG